MPKQTVVLLPSRIVWVLWVITQMIAWIAVLQLFYLDRCYLIVVLLYFIVAYCSFKKWTKIYKKNRVITLRQLYPFVPTFWEIVFKNGYTQKIQLTRYYRTVFLIIMIYKPINKTRVSTLVLPIDSLSKIHYQKLAIALWPGQ